MGKATLYDIASKLGVDVSTVSRAIRNDKRVNKKTIERVKNMAARLRYTPNLAARSLANGKTNTVWMLVPGLSNPIEIGPAKYASIRLLENNYDLLIVQHHNDMQIYTRLLEKLEQGVADGAIVIPGKRDNFATEKRLIENNYPLVFLDRYPENINAFGVTTNNYKAAFDLVPMLIKKGAKRFIVDFGEDNPVAMARRKGAIDSCKKHDAVFTLRENRNKTFPLNEESAFLGSTASTAIKFTRKHKAKALAGVFDSWNENDIITKAVVCIQDFEKMADIASNIIATINKGEKMERQIILVEAKEYIEIG